MQDEKQEKGKRLLFSKKKTPSKIESNEPVKYWKMLIVDDEEEVHTVTRLVLEDYFFPPNGKLEILSAYSGKEAIEVLKQHPDTAVVLLDVVMETNDAGLRVVKTIREELLNRFVRIVLRTGQPGLAPEKEVVLKYDINDYKDKTELTTQKLFTTITAAVRSYSDIMTIESYRRNLEEKVIEKTKDLQKKNKELDQAVKRLVELDREKDEFLGIAAHDLKNPLNNILMIASMINDPDVLLSEDEIREYMEQVILTTQRMSNIIANLLDVNAIEAGKLNLISQPLNLVDLTQRVVAEFTHRAHAKEIMLSMDSDCDRAMVVADEDALFQVMENLVSNAIKFSPYGKNVLVKVLEHQDAYCMEIRDEGPGLTPADQDKLFKKFAKLKNKPTGGETSTGLGLSIVKKLIEAMGGSVWCESAPGKGAAFCFVLPREDSASEGLIR